MMCELELSSLVTMTQEVTRSTICPEIEAITPVLHQRTIRKRLVTSGAGFNGHQYGMNSRNSLFGYVWCRANSIAKERVASSNLVFRST